MRELLRPWSDLRSLPILPLGVGWDNLAVAVGEWVFRFPRRQLGADLLQIELRWLPTLAAGLPARVSAPERVGAPTPWFPWPYAGYRRIDGRTGCGPALDAASRAPLAAPLGAFLRALHGLPVPAGAPVDGLRRADTGHRASSLKEIFARRDDGADLCELVDTLAGTAGWHGPACWVHGDLHPRHVVVGAAGDLAGIIDWGDLHAGDPALDLSIALTFLPAAARDVFRAAYGPIDRPTWDRARFRALHYGAHLTRYGRAVGDLAMHLVGERALRAAAES
jgi:aminoglycoside phosphotransferase (APT) family kinase protein